MPVDSHLTIIFVKSLLTVFLFLLQELLTKHKMLAADFLEANFDKVFTQYQKLLHSDNYVTRRQSLKLLGELLLDRHNFSVSIQVQSPHVEVGNFQFFLSCR
jgi:hypothetical protein